MIVKAWLRVPNWGDLINKELVRMISGQEPALIPAIESPGQDNYLICGSVAGYADELSTIWGAGFLTEYDRIEHVKEIRAVRGPITRYLIRAQGLECPEIYGDPALLLPRYYKPRLIKRHAWGVVLHYSDLDHEFQFANVIRPDLPSFEFIDRILECERIMSSSLHGLVVAEAYGIPAEQLKLNGPIYQLKFDDYNLAKGRVNLDKLMEVCPLA